MNRDLKADLITCRSAISGRHYLEVARKGWPEAINRAIEAEEKLVKMQAVVDAAIRKVDADKKDVPFGEWTKLSDELREAVEALEGGPPCPK